MKKVPLTKSGLLVSEVGFGCSALLGGTSREEALSLLETAYDLGVTHFDVARYYGYGDAEKILGEFLKGKRSSVTVTTKFGMMPDPRVAELSGAISVVRSLMRRFGWIKKLVRKKVSSVVKSRQFDIPNARKSIEDSLRALDTDCIDLYLMHECYPEDVTDEIMQFLQDLKSSGKIREFGIGTTFDNVNKILASRPEVVEVAQIPSDIIENNRSLLGDVNFGVITHGSFHRFDKVSAMLPEYGPEFIAHLLLSHALMMNRGGSVLFRTKSEEKLKKNLTALTQTPLADEEILRLCAKLQSGQSG